ncbi:unnamed protein product [Moneuplotes crassus]|uniref:Uncharacterized protein n=1 Tax=Euplotes crassus TaxID=5936 RepID=A0AAD1XAC3_EUPCR|nr:unnamed protein product [Moneuplotes crassus]
MMLKPVNLISQFLKQIVSVLQTRVLKTFKKKANKRMDYLMPMDYSKNSLFPNIKHQASLSGTPGRFLRDKSMESVQSAASQTDDNPHRKNIREKVIQYCKPKVEYRKSFVKKQNQPRKKLVLSKLDKMRILSETQLRQLLCKEIQENKKFLESRSKLFKRRARQSISIEDKSPTQIHDEEKDMEFKSIRISNHKLSINPLSTKENTIRHDQFKNLAFYRGGIETKKSRRCRTRRDPVKISRSYFLKKSTNPKCRLMKKETTIETVYPKYCSKSNKKLADLQAELAQKTKNTSIDDVHISSFISYFGNYQRWIFKRTSNPLPHSKPDSTLSPKIHSSDHNPLHPLVPTPSASQDHT